MKMTLKQIVLALCILALPGSVARAQSIRIVNVPVEEARASKIPVGRKLVEIRDASFLITYVTLRPGARIELAVGGSGLSGSNSGSSLGLFFKTEQPVAALNGGFLRTLVPATPAGFVSVNGAEVNRPADRERDPVMSAVACFGGGPTMMVPSERLREIQEKFQYCLQAGPLILYQGEPYERLETFVERYPEYKRFVTRTAERSFILRTARDETVLGVTGQASLLDLRAVFQASEKEGGFGARDAMTMTGRSTAGLIVAGRDGPVEFGGTAALLPNAIVVRQ
jgi:hypothetical protein